MEIPIQRFETEVPTNQLTSGTILKKEPEEVTETMIILGEIKNDQLAGKTKDISSQIASLGLFAFGMTGFINDLCGVGAFKINSSIYAMGFFYAGVAQFVAGIISWKKGSAFGACAFCGSGSYWMSYVGMKIFKVKGWEVSPDKKGMGIFLLTWTIFDLFLFICTLKMFIAFILIFGSAFVKLVFKTIGKWRGNDICEKIGSYFGLLEAICALYTAGAFVLNKSFKMTVLPIGKPGEKLCAKTG